MTVLLSDVDRSSAHVRRRSAPSRQPHVPQAQAKVAVDSRCPLPNRYIRKRENLPPSKKNPKKILRGNDCLWTRTGSYLEVLASQLAATRFLNWSHKEYMRASRKSIIWFSSSKKNSNITRRCMHIRESGERRYWRGIDRTGAAVRVSIRPKLYKRDMLSHWKWSKLVSCTVICSPLP